MQLTNTQRALLEAAAKHPQKKLVVFPDNLKGGARIKVLPDPDLDQVSPDNGD